MARAVVILEIGDFALHVNTDQLGRRINGALNEFIELGNRQSAGKPFPALFRFVPFGHVTLPFHVSFGKARLSVRLRLLHYQPHTVRQQNIRKDSKFF